MLCYATIQFYLTLTVTRPLSFLTRTLPLLALPLRSIYSQSAAVTLTSNNRCKYFFEMSPSVTRRIIDLKKNSGRSSSSDLECLRLEVDWWRKSLHQRPPMPTGIVLWTKVFITVFIGGIISLRGTARRKALFCCSNSNSIVSKG